jgi:hypothetical protein
VALVFAVLETPALAQAARPAAFQGIWSTAFTAAAESGWQLADFYCFTACTSEGRGHAQRLLADVETAQQSALELYPHAVGVNIRSVKRLADHSLLSGERPPGFSCEPLGFAAQVVSPLPLEIMVAADRVSLRYEESAATRMVWLEPATAPYGDDLPLGVSKGRFEDGALVIETSEIPAGRLSDWLGGFAHGNDLHATERYSVSADGRWLELTLTLDDPATFSTPLVVTKRWVRAAGARIAHNGCGGMAAGLGGVFAEYLDPRLVEAARRAVR